MFLIKGEGMFGVPVTPVSSLGARLVLEPARRELLFLVWCNLEGRGGFWLLSVQIDHGVALTSI